MEDKANKRALEKYPKKIEWVGNQWDGAPFDVNSEKRFYYQQGYNQAEKDFELSLEDIRTILNIENDILSECNSQKELVIETYPKGEDYYGEILKRFKERKENAKVNV